MSHLFFVGKNISQYFCTPLLTLQPSLAEDLKCTGLGSVRIPLIQIRGFSPQLEGQVRSLHCNIENSQFRQCKTYHLMKLQVFCLLKVPLPENYSQFLEAYKTTSITISYLLMKKPQEARCPQSSTRVLP